MKVNPLLQPKLELGSAWESAHKLAAAKTLLEADRAWRATLIHLEVVWNMVKDAASPFDSKFHNWNASFVKARKSDPLLLYLHHARNATHHTIQESTELIVGSLSGSFDSNVQMKWTGPEIVALAVVDRDISYPVPTRHLAESLQSSHPVFLATSGCNYYAGYLNAVHTKFFAGVP